MLTPELLTADQQNGIDRLYEHDHTLLVGKMGSGKTIVTLSAIAELLASGTCKRILVVAPLKVCKTVWKQEAANWSHTAHITISLCVGNEKARISSVAERSQVTVINFENLPWLFKQKAHKNYFDGLVIDELSKLKAVGGAQFKSIRHHLKNFVWRVGLTGTPVSEDWAGLFGQMMIVDGGASLGTRKDKFMTTYFYPTDYMKYNWELHSWGAAAIATAISDYVYTLPDYRSELPPVTYETINVVMPPELRDIYTTLKNDMCVDEVEAANAAVLSGKLQQASSGFLYVDDGADTWNISDYRIDAAIDAIKNSDGPTLLAYWFKADYARLVERLNTLDIVVGDLSVGDIEVTCDRWNAGWYDVMLLHPRSAGHGLNLAKGGNRVLWFAPQWSRDLWEQLIARVWRRGQTQPVTVTTIMSDADIDDLVALRVSDKAEFDRLFNTFFS